MQKGKFSGGTVAQVEGKGLGREDFVLCRKGGLTEGEEPALSYRTGVERCTETDR